MLETTACAESFCNCVPLSLVCSFLFLIWWLLLVSLLVGTASSSSGTQQTSHFLLKSPAEFFFLPTCELAFLDGDASALGAEATKSQWVTSCLRLTPVLNIVHNVAQFRTFDINRILLSLAENFFPNHILCYWLYWSEPTKWILN